MALAQFPSPMLRRQPNGLEPWRYTINLNNRLSRGLVFLALPTTRTWFDLVTRTFAVRSSTLVGENKANRNIDGAQGLEMRITSTADKFTWSAQQTLLDKVAGPFSLFMEGGPRANAAFSEAFFSDTSLAANGLGMVWDDLSFAANAFFPSVNATVINISGPSLGANSENFSHRVMVTADGTNIRKYAKGTSTSSANAALPTANADRSTKIGGDFHAGGKVQGETFCAAWNRALSYQEFRGLYDNPWQLITPLPKYQTYFYASAAAGTLLKANYISLADLSQLNKINKASVKSANTLTTGN